MIFHFDVGVIKGCKNLEESYGTICVKCNRCGRFDDECKTPTRCHECNRILSCDHFSDNVVGCDEFERSENEYRPQGE